MTILINGLAQADSMSEIEAEEFAQICGGFLSGFGLNFSNVKTEINTSTQSATIVDGGTNVQAQGDSVVNFFS